MNDASIADVIAGRARWATLVGDARVRLRDAPDGIAQTCVTSTPYYGLRDYGGGAAEIGRETTPREFITALVEVFREVRRVLADDGTLWVNIGDSYANGGGATQPHRDSSSGGVGKKGTRGAQPYHSAGGGFSRPSSVGGGCKPKDLLGIPWMLAFALRDDGWYLRSDIVWAKPNPMPESVTDRPTRAHEFVFLLSKRARYFYDGDAIREPASTNSHGGNGPNAGAKRAALQDVTTTTLGQTTHALALDGRNARDVWTITPEPFDGAHFATMPPDLARRCILAGSRRGDIVVDPFGGAATTALVALQEGRRALLCELNPAYVDIQRERLACFEGDTIAPVRVKAPEWGALFDGGPR